tara:strand:- start:134 stop:1114 length:981 start_codon:yes stop_codon:yes gene_type:complete
MPKPGTGRIDTHVHYRDEEQSYKFTIAQGLRLATAQGIDIVFDMPNTARPVIDRTRVYERLALVPKGEEDRYFLYVGLTDDPAQIEEAVWCYEHIDPVIGFKGFPGPSVGNLAVTDPDKQMNWYKLLREFNCKAPVTVHCERDDFIRKTPDGKQDWDPMHPITHSYARPWEAEVYGVLDQMRFVVETGYEGPLHIAHASLSESVALISRNMNVSCEVTPHHAMWDNTKMEPYPEGLKYKMNPPLRSPGDVAQLMHDVIHNKIDCIGTDHAPHTYEEKFGPPYMSGYPSQTLYRQFVEVYLPGLGMSEEDIRAMTSDNARRIFPKAA